MSQYNISLISSILSGPTNVTVLVPNPVIGTSAEEFYRSGKKYKVLWLLHAGNGGSEDWINYTKIALYVQNQDVIVVMPNALNTDYADHPQFADGYGYEDFFFSELMPFVQNWFPASADPADNIIAGYSMGAAATWMFGLQHPKAFRYIVSIASALKDYRYLESYRGLTAAEFRALYDENPGKIPAGYGPPGATIHLKEVNMITKYASVGAFLDGPEHTYPRFEEAARENRLPRAYVPCGKDDRAVGGVIRFQEYAASVAAEGVTFDVVAGGGGYEFCDQILPTILDLFRK